MADIRELTGKTVTTLREEGIVAVAKKAKNLVQMSVIEGKDAKNKVFRDVLFINGCDESVPHPARYRVRHQREQFEPCLDESSVLCEPGIGSGSVL